MINTLNVTRSTDFLAGFVLPNYSSKKSKGFEHLKKTIDSIISQADQSWRLVVIDDSSDDDDAIGYLNTLQFEYPDRVTVLFNKENQGPGLCRNQGIFWNKDNNIPITLFIDSDDLCHPDRVGVTRDIFKNNGNVSVVYSSFSVIDEYDTPVLENKLSPSIREILDSHKSNPPQGKNAWIDIGTGKGYTNLTSTTSVRTDIAFKYLFPPERVSEDAHAWFRYSAGGGDFFYTDEIPALYRIPSKTEGSSSRSREGGRHAFYKKMVEIDEDGFKSAIAIALQNGKIEKTDVNDILIKYYLKQSETMALEGEVCIAQEQFSLALEISEEKTRQFITLYDGLKAFGACMQFLRNNIKHRDKLISGVPL